MKKATCRGCTERDAEIKRLKGALAERARELERARGGGINAEANKALVVGVRPNGHAMFCCCIQCRAGRE